MSIEASIDLRVTQLPLRTLVSPIKILQKLLKFGWTLQHDGRMFYLPLGDDDMFDWTDEKMSVVSFMKILEEKERRNELIGVRLTWQDTKRGGNILLQNSENMSKSSMYDNILFSLDANRKILNDDKFLKIIDVNWYLTKLLPIFNDGDTLVEHFTYDEHI